MIAAVIYNRLREGMPLGIDATIYYAVELQKGIATYTGELTESQLQIDSPYNTRTHKGLPPTPISNPGDASIHAAAHPAARLLPVLRGGRRRLRRAGVLRHTYAQFEANVAAYQAAVKQERRAPAELQEEEVMRRLGVLGWPVAHSRSPAMHNAALARSGMQRLALPAPAGAAGAVRADDARAGRRGLRRRQRDDPAQAGRARARRQASAAAREIGAANTLTFAADGDDRARRTPTPPA